MAKISICVPTSDYNRLSKKFTKELFESIKKQTFKDYEVCISDHSLNDDVLEVCEEYANYFTIKYFKNSENIGNGPANTNSSLEMAEGEIVKIMFQDDFFFSKHALYSINENFSNTDKKWLVSGCNHLQENYYCNEFFPRWNSDIIRGVNTISSPSVLSIKKTVIEKFDQNLTMLMDCEYYYNLYIKYGDPIFVNEIHVTNRIHENQISAKYVKSDDYKEKFNQEINYCKNKYNLV